MATRKGPNDSRGIDWALGECFSSFLCIFDANLYFIADLACNLQTT